MRIYELPSSLSLLSLPAFTCAPHPKSSRGNSSGHREGASSQLTKPKLYIVHIHQQQSLNHWEWEYHILVRDFTYNHLLVERHGDLTFHQHDCVNQGEKQQANIWPSIWFEVQQTRRVESIENWFV